MASEGRLVRLKEPDTEREKKDADKKKEKKKMKRIQIGCCCLGMQDSPGLTDILNGSLKRYLIYEGRTKKGDTRYIDR